VKTLSVGGRDIHYNIPSNEIPEDPNDRDGCYCPGCRNTPFADFSAIFVSTSEFFDGADAIAVIFTCQEHNTAEFTAAKALLVGKCAKEAIAFSRAELHSHARWILGDRADRMSRGIETAF
jgi:hypothetical protein